MLDKIKKHLQNGEIDEALAKLQYLEPDAVVLMQQHKNAERSYTLGLIDYNQYAMVRNRVTYAAQQFIEVLEKKETEPEVEVKKETVIVRTQHTTESTAADPATIISQEAIAPIKKREKKEKFKIFYSYSKADVSQKMRLDTHFSALKRSDKVEIWHDGLIQPGEDWNSNIKTALEESDIILLLITADFIASDYIWEKELPRALERHNEGSAVVVPIFLKPCDWKDMPFAHIQGLPRNATPLVSYGNMDAAIRDVVKGVRSIIENYNKGL